MMNQAEKELLVSIAGTLLTMLALQVLQAPNDVLSKEGKHLDMIHRQLLARMGKVTRQKASKR